ncbi:hypothetical protein IPF89_02550 [Candidatus Saccharibacteria bacterium]|nr:MAG: hypothetical protein IPF89_02550 [Candidatus Saccharibacteria bacterium]
MKPKVARKARHFFSGELLPRMLILAVVWAVDNLASLAAYQHGNVSIIAPLLQTSAILSVLVAIIFLGKELGYAGKLLHLLFVLSALY